MGGDEQGHHGGPPGHFIGHDMVSNGGTAAMTGSDTRRCRRGFWGVNLGENGAYGRRATSIECWAGSRRPGSSLSATKTWPASSSSVSVSGKKKNVVFLFFYTDRYVSRAELGCGGVGLVLGRTWWAAAVLNCW
jgi:hypothetical protein